MISSREAPMLERLELYLQPGYERVALPLLFNGVCPSLTRLSLTGFVVCGPNHFGHLTNLELHKQGYTAPEDLIYLLDLLRACPHLVDLAFSECCAPVPQLKKVDVRDWTSGLAIRDVSLPRLRSITFGAVSHLLVGSLLPHVLPSKEKMFTLLYTPCNNVSMLKNWEAVEEQGAIERLHLLDPHWTEVSVAPQKVYVGSHNCKWTIAVTSLRTQLCVAALEATPEQLYALLGGIVGRVPELWVCMDLHYAAVFHGFEVACWLVAQANAAKRIYLDIEGFDPKTGLNGFDVLRHVFSDAAAGGIDASLEECHVVVRSRGDGDGKEFESVKKLCADVNAAEAAMAKRERLFILLLLIFL